MDRKCMERRFSDAASRARDFARDYLTEDLPKELRFRVRLNESYDGNANPNVVLYPEDSGVETARANSELSLEDAFSLLWRDGRVPEWVNLSVVGELGYATLIELLCCGRFTDDAKTLYHQQEGYPPFHVLGPTLPPRWKNGERFSVYHRTECSTLAELERATS